MPVPAPTRGRIRRLLIIRATQGSVVLTLSTLDSILDRLDQVPLIGPLHTYYLVVVLSPPPRCISWAGSSQDAADAVRFPRALLVSMVPCLPRTWMKGEAIATLQDGLGGDAHTDWRAGSVTWCFKGFA